jgi:hypothetical protein
MIMLVIALSACSNNNDVTIDYKSGDSNGNIKTVETFDVTKVNMKEVESSAIAYIGYLNGRLIIVFNSSLDRCYVYDDVAYDDYTDLINAESIGGYYNKHIKNVYDQALRIDDIYVSNGHIKYK